MDTQKAKQTFMDIKKVLNKSRVKFWLVDGVALGAVRSGDFIPYDRDIDLRIMAGCDLKKLSKAFKDAGFSVLVSINPALYGSKPSGLVLRKRNIKTDMCLGYFYPPGDKIVVLAGAPRSNYDVLPASLFMGNHYITFCGTRARIPYPTEEYLTLHYGKDWMVPVKGGSEPPDAHSISLKKYSDYFNKHPEANQQRG